jgi:hypothetical protein
MRTRGNAGRNRIPDYASQFMLKPGMLYYSRRSLECRQCTRRTTKDRYLCSKARQVSIWRSVCFRNTLRSVIGFSGIRETSIAAARGFFSSELRALHMALWTFQSAWSASQKDGVFSVKCVRPGTLRYKGHKYPVRPMANATRLHVGRTCTAIADSVAMAASVQLELNVHLLPALVASQSHHR